LPRSSNSTTPYRGAAQAVGEVRAVKDVVAKRQRDTVRADEIAADEKCLGEPFGAGLRRVLNRQPEIGAVAEQPAEPFLLVRRRDDEDVADAGKHQRR
jgi:hypothetical protein